MRSMVEGALHEGIAQPNSPSTAFGGPPPRSGEDLYPAIVGPFSPQVGVNGPSLGKETDSVSALPYASAGARMGKDATDSSSSSSVQPVGPSTSIGR